MAMNEPDQSDLDWQVKKIEDWSSRQGRNGLSTFVKVSWFGGNKQWLPTEEARLHDPFLRNKYAVECGLTCKPGWEWTWAYLDTDDPITDIVKAFKVSKFLKSIKFVVKVTQSTKQALEMDKRDGTSLWKEAMETEINQLHAHETFRTLKDDEPVPDGYKMIPYHCIYDVKFDGRRKCRLVANGHMTDPASEDVFSGVVNMETMRICFVLAIMNKFKVVAGDIGIAYLY